MSIYYRSGWKPTLQTSSSDIQLKQPPTGTLEVEKGTRLQKNNGRRGEGNTASFRGLDVSQVPVDRTLYRRTYNEDLEQRRRTVRARVQSRRPRHWYLFSACFMLRLILACVGLSVILLGIFRRFRGEVKFGENSHTQTNGRLPRSVAADTGREAPIGLSSGKAWLTLGSGDGLRLNHSLPSGITNVNMATNVTEGKTYVIDNTALTTNIAGSGFTPTHATTENHYQTQVSRVSRVTSVFNKPLVVDRDMLIRAGILGDPVSRVGDSSQAEFMPVRDVGKESYEDLDKDSGNTRAGVSWPPRIVRIPDQRSSRSRFLQVTKAYGDPLSTESRSRLLYHDSLYCHHSASISSNDTLSRLKPCRFLLPLTITEQESKSRLHIRQLAYLARKTGRVLILPEVGRGRAGIGCRPRSARDKSWEKEKERFSWSAASYWDVGAWTIAGVVKDVDQGEMGITPWAITLDEFLEWVASRPNEARARVVRLLPKPFSHSTLTQSESTDMKFTETQNFNNTGNYRLFNIRGAVVNISAPTIPRKARFARGDSQTQTQVELSLSCLVGRAPRLRFGVFEDLTIVNVTGRTKQFQGTNTNEGDSRGSTGPFSRAVLELLAWGDTSIGRLHLDTHTNLDLATNAGSHTTTNLNDTTQAQTTIGKAQLDEFNVDSEAEVLAVDWQLKHPLFDLDSLSETENNPRSRIASSVDVPQLLGYSPRLETLANAIVDFAKRFAFTAWMGNYSFTTSSEIANPVSLQVLLPKKLNCAETGYMRGSAQGLNDIGAIGIPLVVVHWRMETVTAENLPGCADELVMVLERILGRKLRRVSTDRSDITNVEEYMTMSRARESNPINGESEMEAHGTGDGLVWLATDFPYEVVGRNLSAFQSEVGTIPSTVTSRDSRSSSGSLARGTETEIGDDRVTADRFESPAEKVRKEENQTRLQGIDDPMGLSIIRELISDVLVTFDALTKNPMASKSFCFSLYVVVTT